jgi:hypothetical protein
MVPLIATSSALSTSFPVFQRRVHRIHCACVHHGFEGVLPVVNANGKGSADALGSLLFCGGTGGKAYAG